MIELKIWSKTARPSMYGSFPDAEPSFFLGTSIMRCHAKGSFYSFGIRILGAGNKKTGWQILEEKIEVGQ